MQLHRKNNIIELTAAKELWTSEVSSPIYLIITHQSLDRISLKYSLERYVFIIYLKTYPAQQAETKSKI